MGQNPVEPQQPVRLLRKADWQTALDRFLVSQRAAPFRYGGLDCCLFVCDAILAMTGVDVAAPFRGAYASRRQAFRAIERYAGRASVEAVAEHVCAQFGMPEVTPRTAQRGDVVLLARRHDYSLGLIDLTGRLAVPTTQGYLQVPLLHGCRAWRV